MDQAASLDRMEEFVGVRRTLIGTDVSALLSVADGPGATRLFSSAIRGIGDFVRKLRRNSGWSVLIGCPGFATAAGHRRAAANP
jgi:hypothetical protein